ncbi:MAG: putative toxin-antitoxin system toxin component, PIN family [Ottowia sp.]|nr:putative toxin-antitoxin system toxin component, PIN family [Ottowia sp.]
MTGKNVVFAVLDTNVLVSAQLKLDSVPRKILTHALTGTIIPIINDGIFAEYDDVLRRPKLKLATHAVDKLFAALRKVSVTLAAGDATVPREHMPDADDAVFYATALASRAAGNATYLVTGNLRHFPQEDFIVSPRAMLDIIGRSA